MNFRPSSLPVVSWTLLLTAFAVLEPSSAQPAKSPPANGKPKPEQPVDTRRQPTIGQPQPVFAVQSRFSAAPTDTELQLATDFQDRLVPMSLPVIEGENLVLAGTLQQFVTRARHEDLSMLEAFLLQYPSSRWNASLLLNMGLERYSTGYLTQALMFWESAWSLAKNETGPQQRAIADRAIGDLLLLNARLGRVDVMKKFLAEVGERPLEGSVAANVQAAKEGLARMTVQPEIAFKCGPFALNSILNLRDQTPDRRAPELETAQSTSQGTNLLQVLGWAGEVGLDYQMAKRDPDAPIIYPAVMHWKLDHFAALLTESDGRYLVQDATFGGAEIWISANALEAETDGYFLVPAGPLPAGWRAVGEDEGQIVWGKGGASARDENAKSAATPKRPCECPSPGMPSSSYYLMQASLNIQDVPLFYQPPVGPSVHFLMNYNHNETGEPEINTHSNLGPNWDFNWVGYLEVKPDYNVTIRLREGGTEIYHFSLFNNLTNAFKPDIYSQAVLKWTTNEFGKDVYRRELSDGSVEVYSQPGQKNTVGRYYLKEVIDPTGNKITINYEVYGGGRSVTYTQTTEPDETLRDVPGENTIPGTKPVWTGRINELVDAAGNVTFIRYVSNDTLHAGFRKIKRITDPWGRTVEFGYDGLAKSPGKINSIKDVVGMVSTFRYASDGFIEVMETPYGKTLFHRYNQAGELILEEDPDKVPLFIADMMRGLKITYPNGSTAIVESWLGHTMKTFHWDRLATKAYPLEPLTGDPAQYQHCEIYQWRLRQQSNELSAIPYSFKRPLQAEVVFDYESAGETKDEQEEVTHTYTGASNQPTSVTDGERQTSAAYNLLGNLTESVDPRGRKTRYYYDGNGVDLLEVRQVIDGTEDLLAKMAEYDERHMPRKIYDASGSATAFTYNNYSQVKTVTDALGRVTTLEYVEPLGSTNPSAHDSLLQSIDGPLPAGHDKTTFTYDNFQRVESVTDPDGYTTWYEYDNLNRIIKTTYQPEGVALADCEYEEVVWDRLNPVLIRDRKGRLIQREYNEMQRLVSETDSEGRRLEFEWCTCGSLTKLRDGNGHVTRWEYDILGRVTKKVRHDGRTETYDYYPNQDRVQFITIADEVRKELKYNLDDTIREVIYHVRSRDANGNPVTENELPKFEVDPNTPSILYTYSDTYPRLESVASSAGVISYSYYPYRKSSTDALSLGAGALERILDAGLDAAVEYAYDELGRVDKRWIKSVVNGQLVDDNHLTDLDYDTAGRLAQLTDMLGTFGYDYHQASSGLSRLASITNPNGTSTTFGWHPASQHHRLRSIAHTFSLGANGVAGSRNLYGYSHGGQLRSWTKEEGTGTEQVDYGLVEDWVLEHDDADQLRSVVVRDGNDILRQYYYSYDKGGNRISTQTDHRVLQLAYNEINQIIGQPDGGLVRFEGTLDELGTVKVDGVPARMRTVLDGAGNPEFRFSAEVPLDEGLNRVNVVARDTFGNEGNELYDVAVTGQTGQGTPAYDSRGNMTANGRGQTYKWDAANRLVKISYANGGRTEFAYDALGRRSREVEFDVEGMVASEKRFLWCGYEICQQRSAFNAVVRRYSPHGFMESDGKKRFYARDHLGSVTHLTDETGQAVDRYEYDPYGVQPMAGVNASLPNLPNLQFRLRANSNVIKDANNKVSEWRTGVSPDVFDLVAPTTAAQPTWVGDAIRFDGNDDVLEGALGTNIQSSNVTIFIVHRRLGDATGAAPLSFSAPVPAGEPDSPDGALALAWQNVWQGSTTLTAGLGIAGTGPSGSTWSGPAVETAPGQTGFQITTLTKANTVQLSAPWTYSADLTLRNRNLSGATESSATLTAEVVGGSPRYALGRLFLSAGAGEGFLQGDIAEVIVYIGALDETGRQAVEDYLVDAYLPKVQSDFRYTGHYYHGKSGLHMAPYRAYDAELGVWISEDPIEEAGGINLYGYVENGPMTSVDPLGQVGFNADGSFNFGWSDAGVIAGAIGAGAMQCLDAMNPFDDPFLRGGLIPEEFDTNFGAEIAGYTNPTALGASGLVKLNKISGGIKQWIRVGKSYSHSQGKAISLCVRWGASPKYADKIINSTLRKINQALRKMKLPGRSWRTQDPGHFHLRE